MDGEAPPETGREPRDLDDLVAGRLGEYVELWTGAAARMLDGAYRSEDLIDDWFRFWGNVSRDLTAGASLAWKAGAAAGRRSTDQPDQGG